MKRLCVVYLFSLVFLSACISRPANMILVGSSRIVNIESAELQQNLLIQDLVAELVEEKLNLQLIIENASTDSLNFEYRVQWFSVTGFRVDQVYERGWEGITLKAKEVKVIHIQGHSPAARKYQLTIREVVLGKVVS